MVRVPSFLVPVVFLVGCTTDYVLEGRSEIRVPAETSTEVPAPTDPAQTDPTDPAQTDPGTDVTTETDPVEETTGTDPVEETTGTDPAEETTPAEEPPVEEPPVEEPPVEEPPVEEPPAPADDCAHVEDAIYVIDRADDALYTFDPATRGFSFVGDLNCGMWVGDPQSMAVSRDGFAYVRYSDDRIYAVNLQTMRCTATPFVSPFGSFGMGFAMDDGSAWQDTLYVADDTGLASLDTASWQLSNIGAMPSQSELTGNAAGELWAFLPLETPAELVQLDKTSGAALTTFRLRNFPAPNNIDTFAFAAWGSEFWLFVREYGMGNTTDLYRVDATGRMVLEEADTGMDVVGAGVSTCVPAP